MPVPSVDYRARSNLWPLNWCFILFNKRTFLKSKNKILVGSVSKSRSLPSGATFRHAPVPLIGLLPEKFEDTKGVVLSRKSKKDKYTMVKIKITKGQTMIYKTLHRKLKIERTTPVKFPSVTFVGNNAHA